MKKTTATLSGILVAAGLMLTACGNEAEDLASEYCEMTEDLEQATKDNDTEKMQEISKELMDWAKENEDTDVDEDDFKDAVKDECGADVPGL